MLLSAFLALGFDPLDPHRGPFLDLLDAVRRRRLGLPEALYGLLLVRTRGRRATSRLPAVAGGMSVGAAVPLVSPRRPVRVVDLHEFVMINR